MLIPDLYGLVLTGGRSSRMGKDKALIDYHGKPQRNFLFELLSAFCSDVHTSCRQDQEIPAHLNPITDRFSFHSPLNGIVSALKTYPDVAWLVVAVDMPNVDENVIDLLVSSRDKMKTATCFYNSITQLPEPLLTIWEPGALGLLLEFIDSGKISPREFLASHNIRMVQPPDQHIFRNVNSPGDLD